MLHQREPLSRPGALKVVRIHSKEEAIQTWDGGGSTGIGAGIDPAEGRTLLDDPRRRNKERDPEKAATISSSEDYNDSVSESGGTLARSFWARLLSVWEADRFLLAVP